MEIKPLTTIPGTRDILPEEIARWHFLEDEARRLFHLFGFQEIRTPIFEATELFARGIGGGTDIVGKEMYTFEDESGKSITLRPEATASTVRAFIEHHMYRGGGIRKLYYIGPMFRHERKQKGRWRQFYQVGAEVFGSDHPAVEAEVIEMLFVYLDRLRIQARLWINSVGCPQCRPAFVELLRADLRKILPQLCEDCRRRVETNPLRVLDCKVESCQPLIDRLPALTEHLCETCAQHFEQFKSHLTGAGIRYDVKPRLVRGLDYYIRTAFEIVSGDLGAQNALAGGGRYDGLSEVLGGPPLQGFGFAMGLDRLVMIMPNEVGLETAPRPALFCAYLGDAAFRKALSICRSLRRQGIPCTMDFAAGSLKSQMRLASKVSAQHVLIIGDDELARDRFTLRRLKDSVQWEVSLVELEDYLRAPTAG